MHYLFGLLIGRSPLTRAERCAHTKLVAWGCEQPSRRDNMRKLFLLLFLVALTSAKMVLRENVGTLDDLRAILLASCQNASYLGMLIVSKPGQCIRSVSERFGSAGTSDYYLSASGSDGMGDGTQSKPWATINYANSKLGSRGYPLGVGGTVVHVADGIYNVTCSANCTAGYGGEAIRTTVSGDASARVRWISDNRWGAHIVSSGYTWTPGKGIGAANGAASTWSNAGDYVDIIGFDITGDGQIGIKNDGSYVRTLSNHIHNITAPGACEGFSGGSAGIDDTDNSSGRNNDAIGNWIHDIGNLKHPCASGGHGLYQAAYGGKLQNNLIYRVQGYGVHMWHRATNISVTFNTVFQGYGGIVVGGSGGSKNDFTAVSNNIFVNNLTSGISEEGSVGDHNTYANNITSGNDNNLSLVSGHSAIRTINAAASTVFLNWQLDGSGNYHLKETSPAIDAASSAYTVGTDFDGGVRPVNGLYDIGCYEYKSAPAKWPWW